MKTCKHCGSMAEDSLAECLNCGKAFDAKETPDAAQILNDLNNTADTTADHDAADIEKNKVFALLSYIFVLWLVPLLAAPNSKFARYHANQGLVLFLVEVILGVVFAILSWIPIINILSGVVGFVVGIAGLALMILGILNAANGKAKELPLIGKITLLK